MDDILIYLESDDEITAVIDRLRAAKGDMIRFVVPKGALVLQSLVSLKLLKREADHLGKTISIVTQDAVGLNLGEQANISVYAKPKDQEPVFAARAESNKVSRRTSRPELPENDDDEEESSTLTETNPDESVSKEENPEEDSEQETDVVEEDKTDKEDIEKDEVVKTETDNKDNETIPVHHYNPDDSKNNKDSMIYQGAGLKALRQASHSHSWPHKILRITQLVLVLAIVIAGSYFAFLQLAPRAVVNLTFSTQPLSQDILLSASTQAQQIDLANAIIPARSIKQDVTTQQSAPATGKKEIGSRATATLNLSNAWSSDVQTLASGTVFASSDGTQFTSTAAVTIPGAVLTLKDGAVNTVPGTANITVQAVDPGTGANGKTGTFTIPSLPQNRQSKIYGTAVAATAGGTSRQVTVVTQSDLDTLKNTVRDALAADGKDKLSKASEGNRLLDGAYNLTVSSETYSAKVGDQADTLTGNASGNIEGLIFSDPDLNNGSIEVLKKSIPSGRKLILANTDTITPTVKNLDLSKGKLDITITFKTQTALIQDDKAIVNQIIGLSLTDADKQLRSVADVTDVSIDSRPRFLKALPKRDSQVQLNTNYVTTPPTTAVK